MNRPANPVEHPETSANSKGTSLARATNPRATVWVSANAGSGKTYVLSRRVIRLLLEGAKPSELLCLTFTKVAAAEMSNRVFEILAEWAQLNDEKLSEEIISLTGKASDAAQLQRARQLFATALDTPGGLRIQTIHAFCESLLHQFPLEANIPGHFELMSEADQALLMGEARRRVILAGLGISPVTDPASDSMASRLATAQAILLEHASDVTIEKALTQLIGQRDQVAQWVEQGGGTVGEAYRKVWDSFGLSPDQSVHDLYAEFAQQTAYSPEDMERLKSALAAKGGANAEAALAGLAAIPALQPAAAHAARCDVFLKSGWKEGRKYFVSDSFMENNGLFDVFHQEQAVLLSQLEQIKTLEVLRASEALMDTAWAMLTEYGNLKQRRGLLDFPDLISKTANLLSRSEIAAWVQYKLDAGIRHVLVDEAQDTSPVQWKIIRLITEEFYAGVGAREGVRTLFVVGDEKQSIFSFQGADPAEFDTQFRQIMTKARTAGQDPDKVPLTTSYRSTSDILSAVDRVFSFPDNRRGLSSEDIPPVHTANRKDEPGDVYIWPMLKRQKNEEPEEWNEPRDKAGETAAESRLANRITDTIKGWIDQGETLPAHDRPIKPGDILILVRKRDRFVNAINVALKARGLNTAGADRLKLTEHIAVEDMIALGRFATNPHDDLSLAGILKSPLFNFDEERLMAVAIGRKGQSLFEALRTSANTGSGMDDVVRLLTSFIDLADKMPVHDFYARIFARLKLRAKYLDRLGHEVEDIFDGFFQTLMDYDARSGLGLQGFVEWLVAGSPELKRDIELESDEIRVITAHSSKGLEKPIVFLVDSGGEAFSTTHHMPQVLWPGDEPGSVFPIWRSKGEFHLKVLDEIQARVQARGEEEYRRLLYVAMTRAADRLIVCGYGKDSIDYPHWHSMVLNALSAGSLAIDGATASPGEIPLFTTAHDEDGQIVHYKWQVERTLERKSRNREKKERESDPSQLPDWLKPARTEKSLERPLNPSGVLAMLDVLPESPLNFAGGSSDALLKGNLTHQLLQVLPGLEPEKRPGFAEAWLNHAVPTGNPALRTSVLEGVERVLTRPETAAIFGANSDAEVEIAGTLLIAGEERHIRGKIDRLIVGDEQITVADYKTNLQVPDTPQNVPPQYLAQMALYRAMLQQVYPQRTIRSLLIWTENGCVMPLPTELLDQQMERLNKAGTG